MIDENYDSVYMIRRFQNRLLDYFKVNDRVGGNYPKAYWSAFTLGPFGLVEDPYNMSRVLIFPFSLETYSFEDPIRCDIPSWDGVERCLGNKPASVRIDSTIVIKTNTLVFIKLDTNYGPESIDVYGYSLDEYPDVKIERLGYIEELSAFVINDTIYEFDKEKEAWEATRTLTDEDDVISAEPDNKRDEVPPKYSFWEILKNFLFK